MSNFTDETYVPPRITYRPGMDPGAIGAGKFWVDASLEPPAVKVRNKANTAWDDIAGGGSASVKAARTAVIPFSDFNQYVPTPFAITALNTITGEITIAGNHTALFPAGGKASIYGNTGAPSGGIFDIQSSTFGGGNTVVTVSESVAAYTPDGFLTDFGQAGKAIYTPTNPGEIVFAVICSIPDALFSSQPDIGVSCGVYSVPQRFFNSSLPGDGSIVNQPIGISDAVFTDGPAFLAIYGTNPTILGTDPVIVVIDDGGDGMNPGATAGSLQFITVVFTP